MRGGNGDPIALSGFFAVRVNTSYARLWIVKVFQMPGRAWDYCNCEDSLTVGLVQLEKVSGGGSLTAYCLEITARELVKSWFYCISCNAIAKCERKESV